MRSQSHKTLNFFPHLRLLAGFRTQQDAADYFEVHRRTWNRWEKSGKIKRHVREMLKIKAGYLPFSDGHQFRFSDGKLWTPQNYGLSPNVIESLPLLLQSARDTFGYDEFVKARESDS